MPDWSSTQLKQLREAAGLSVSALARLARVSQPQVWRFEHGTTPKGLKPAFAIAAALHCKVTDIWPDAKPQRPQPRPIRRVPTDSQNGLAAHKNARKTPRKPKG